MVRQSASWRSLLPPPDGRLDVTGDRITARRRLSEVGIPVVGAALFLVAIVLVTGCSTQSRAEAGTPGSTTLLAESSVSCFGFTARLALLSEADDVSTTALTVRDVRWRLEVDGPPDILAGDGVVASLDAFTIRSHQANRIDLAALRWSGSTQQISAQGPVRVPEVHGDLRDGDLARILAWIQTPHGSFGVEGVTFRLSVDADGPAALDPSALPTEECPQP